MRKLLFIVIGLLLIGSPVYAQDSTSFDSADALIAALESAADDPAALDDLWEGLVEAGQIPFTAGENAVFLYRGEAETVDWRGDFSGWEAKPEFEGTQIEGSDVWYMTAQFPADARLDYKIVVDGQNWILDPDNPLQQMGGFGPNSELRMPDYVYAELTIPQESIEHGNLSPEATLFSKVLGYAVAYRVYRPVGYPDVTDMPSIYVTDGQEYANTDMGSMVTVMDNLIAAQQIQPVLAVFIDPRNPRNRNENRREGEYIENPAFAEFVANELVPLIDALYKTSGNASSRAILGTSLGGLNAAYFGATYPDVFGLIGIQSPAFWVSRGGRIYQLWEEAETLPQQVFMTNGSYAWDAAEEDVTPLVEILTEKEIPFTYLQVNEGHSWGNWRALLDEVLTAFFPV